MKEGINKRISFDQLTSPHLYLTPKYIEEYEDVTNCGTAALSILTGLSVKYLQRICKGSDFWYIEDMVRFLRKRNFKVVEVTKNNVINNHNWKRTSLNSYHCILMFLKMDAKEFSAFVMHKDQTWHNFETETVNSLFLLNRPTEHVYIIQHKKWLRMGKSERDLKKSLEKIKSMPKKQSFYTYAC